MPTGKQQPTLVDSITPNYFLSIKLDAMKLYILLVTVLWHWTCSAQQYVLTYDAKGNRTGLRITGNLPQPSVSGPVIICKGDSVRWQASGGDRYLWSNGSTGNPVILHPSSTTQFQLTAFTNYGCSTTVSRQLTVLPVPDNYSITGDSIVLVGSTSSYQTPLLAGVAYDWSISNPQHQLTGLPGSQVQVRWSDVPGLDSIRLVEQYTATGCTGKAVYKRVRVVAPRKFDVQLFPNPSGGVITVQLYNNTTEQVSLTILNSIGQLMKQFSVNGSYLYTVRSTPSWFPSSGYYFLRVQSGSELKLIKFLIQW